MHFYENLRFLMSDLASFPDQDHLISIAKGGPFTAEDLAAISRISGIPIGKLFDSKLDDLHKQPQNLKLIIFDVDGVMTDAGMYYTESGDEMKKFNARDGLAIRALRNAGYETGIISHGININLIQKRAELLNVARVYAGNRPKNEVLAEWCTELGITFDQTAFIGDDVNDLPIIRIVGFSACPADALDAVKAEADVILSKSGGQGCIREWADRFLLDRPLGED
jgi:3-deoxy-D-manno-octulosonate 8-phosphate phosphatase (KDO 8-P phosphatase)